MQTTVNNQTNVEKTNVLAGYVPSNEPTKKAESKATEEKKEEVKTAESKPKKAAAKSKKVTVPVAKEAKQKPKKEPKPKAKKAIEKDIVELTYLDGISLIRGANKQVKTLSGAVKMIVQFWKDDKDKPGFNRSFRAIGLELKDITLPNIQRLWNEKMMLEGVYAYNQTKTVYTKDIFGNKTAVTDKEGKVKKETVLVQFNNNFTPEKIYQSIAMTQIEKNLCVWQKNGGTLLEPKKEARTKKRAESKAKAKVKAVA